ncbi:uncharacterized protein LOC107016549 [Solanum pennellii]|uniref:Uncharacterized protein LOC107016549 n=1 Tax=Solanum pennellii TaxID=28526 RepID=A0ABM1GKT0_SOLPN|nr:uncharacterized protein LOC107016549 [Solanum pennellii]
MAQRGSKPAACAMYGRNHLGACRDGSTGYFKCGQNGQLMPECPKNHQGNNKAAPSGAISGTGGGTNRLNALNNRQEQEDLVDIVTSMIQVFDFTVLQDPRASLSFVTPCVAMSFYIIPQKLSKPLCVSTHVGVDSSIMSLS